jgi:hypothetical protein
MQKDVELNLMGFLPRNDFKARLNERFAPQPNLQRWIRVVNLHQGEGLGFLVHYVQMFNALLSPMEEYLHKIFFLKNEVSNSC